MSIRPNDTNGNTDSNSASEALLGSERNADDQSPDSEIKINVYDLLPPSHISSLLWMLGSSILHSGVVVDDKEYAFGWHDNKDLTGVYWTKPRLLPPGATFRCELSMGLPLISKDEMEQIVRQTSQEFLGPSWNLLTNNCNHFTSSLCYRLTGNAPPSWLNRAATLGIALPCLVPKQWLSAPPSAETAEGALVEENQEEEAVAILAGHGESSGGVDGPEFDYASLSEHEGSDTEDILETRNRRRRRIYRKSSRPKVVAQTDSSGRAIPVSEIAPVTGD